MNVDTSVQPSVSLLSAVDPILSTGVTLAKLATVSAISEGAPELALPTAAAFSTISLDTVPTTITEGITNIQSISAPQIKYLLESQYDISSIIQQLATDNNLIIIEREIMDHNVITEVDGKQKSAVLIKERVVDRKYLEQGHITELIEKIRRGEIPTMNQVFLAIIDFTDLVTLKIFNPILSDAKLAITTEEPIYRLKELSAEVFSGSVEKVGDSLKSEKVLSVDIKKRSWYKPDKKTITKDVVETTTKYKNDYIITNIKDVTSNELTKTELDKLISERNTKNLLDDTKNNYASLENNLSRTDIKNIEKHSIALVKENILTQTENYTVIEKGYKRRFLRKATGVKVEKSDTDVVVKSQDEIKQYYINDNINEGVLKHYDSASNTFASMNLVTSVKLDEQVVNKYTDLTKGVEFKDGWISYIPGGSIATIGVKADLGAKVTGMDIFWAGVDVASFALAVATFGASGGLSAALSTAAKGTAKGAVNVVTKKGIKAVAKQTGKVSIKNAQKVGLKSTKVQVAKKATSRMVLDARNSYLDDVVKRSQVKDTIDISNLKKRPWKRISPEKNKIMREQFANRDFKDSLIKEWEDVNNRKWPTYEKDIYSKNGNLIRRAGERFDAHHIQPLGMNGQNIASNITPMHALDHTDHWGIHANGSPYDALNNVIRRNIK